MSLLQHVRDGWGRLYVHLCVTAGSIEKMEDTGNRPDFKNPMRFSLCRFSKPMLEYFTSERSLITNDVGMEEEGRKKMTRTITAAHHHHHHYDTK
mmetsp:Transcript_31101/g.45948  ORF Transcript_31101/g.45948 Transcript_31101/m.45948 type:complete len:95 (-) Transcript_31101:168-452(-)